MGEAVDMLCPFADLKDCNHLACVFYQKGDCVILRFMEKTALFVEAYLYLHADDLEKRGFYDMDSGGGR